MPNAAPNYRWDHIHLRSPDPDATAAWFERILGAQVIRSTVEGKPRIDLKLGGADVFITPERDVGGAPEGGEPQSDVRDGEACRAERSTNQIGQFLGTFTT